MSFFFRVNYYDRLSVEGLSYRAIEITESELSFESTDGRRSSLILTPEQFQDLLKLPTTEFTRGYYLPERQRVREQIDVDAISDLPGERGSTSLWRLMNVRGFLQLESARQTNRTDKAIARVMPDLTEKIAEHEQARQFMYKKPRAGQSVRLRKPPSPRTLREWVRRYERSGGDPLSLIPRYSRCGNTVDRFCLEGRRIMGEAFEAFLSQQRKTKKIIYAICRDRFRRENLQRQAAGMDPLRVVVSRHNVSRVGPRRKKVPISAPKHGYQATDMPCNISIFPTSYNYAFYKAILINLISSILRMIS